MKALRAFLAAQFAFGPVAPSIEAHDETICYQCVIRREAIIEKP